MPPSLPDIRDFDLRHLPASFYDNPYPWYRALQTHDPVRRMPDGSVLLTRYRDVQHVYKHPALFSSEKRAEFKPKYGDSPLFEHHTTSLVFNDPPLHTRVRSLIAGAMHPSAIAEMEPGLIDCVDDLIDALSGRESVDLIEDFAMHIPIEVIGNMLDVPTDERGPLREWSLAILGALEPAPSDAVQLAGNTAVSAFCDYLDDLVARRRRQPGDPDKDVLTRLIQGQDGDSLSRTELLHNCIFILNAGHETTTNLIGNGLYLLAEHPSQRELLLADSQHLSTAVDEFLRMESSNQLGNRITTQAVELEGVELEAHTPVTLCIGAANRDPERFPNPDQLDIQRSPNRHLAFGSGIHQCAGISLAKLEGRIAIDRFLQRFPHYQLSEPPTRGGRVRFRGFLHLPCTLDGRDA